MSSSRASPRRPPGIARRRDSLRCSRRARRRCASSSTSPRGELEAAAGLSNAPQRRLEVLRGFRESVGEEAFRRIFARYFAPENRMVMEAALGRHRLLVWDLGDADHRLVGQYFVEVDGAFLMDDVPSAQRRSLQNVLEAQRKNKLRP